MLLRYSKVVVCLAVAVLGVNGCGSGIAPAPEPEAEGAPEDQNVCERIFIDRRVRWIRGWRRRLRSSNPQRCVTWKMRRISITVAKAKLDDVVNFYINASQLMRQGKLRNGDVRLGAMSLSAEDVDVLVAFLKALTEDYDDA